MFTRLGIALIKLLSKLPLRCLYGVSGVLYFFVFRIFGYRKKVVFENLTYSFPEKNQKEIRDIAKNFYRHFCDLMAEAVKDSGTLEKNLSRIDFSGASILNRYFDAGQSVIVLSFHYGNWEWLKYWPLFLKHRALFVFNPQRHREFDTYFNKVRSKYGGETVTTKGILKRMLQCRDEKILTLTWLGADQTPLKTSKFWTVFLNREAAFFPGPGKLAKKTGQPVLLQYMEKTSRGHYKCIIEPLVENPEEVTEEEILLAYARRIEEIIKQKPEYYLWSHRRWKHKRPADIPLYQPGGTKNPV